MTEWVTRSPIELFWTAKKIKLLPFFFPLWINLPTIVNFNKKLEHKFFQQTHQMEWKKSNWVFPKYIWTNLLKWMLGENWVYLIQFKNYVFPTGIFLEIIWLEFFNVDFFGWILSVFPTLMADYEHFLHCDTCFNYLPRSIRFAALGKTKILNISTPTLINYLYVYLTMELLC